MRTQQVCLFDSFEYVRWMWQGQVVNRFITVSQSPLKLHCRSNLFQSPISYSHRIPVVEMSINPESVSSDITPIATSAADSPTKQRRKQRRTVAKRHIFKRKIYGFVLFKEDLDAWGRQQFGDTDDEKVLKGYISKTISLLFNGSYRLWRIKGPPCTWLPATRALVATSQIFVSPLRTISPPTPPRSLREKSSIKWRRIYALRKILNGIGSTAIERLHGASNDSCGSLLL